jgi:hypothetical protein
MNQMEPGVDDHPINQTEPADDGNALRPWQLRTVVGAAGSLLLSGAAWWLVSRLGRDGTGELPNPAELWLARWHGLSAVAGIFAAGLVAANHVGQGLRLGRRRATGAAMVALGLILVVSGYALAYLAPERWHPALGTAHAGLGLLIFGLLVAHRRGVGEPPPR